MAPEIARCFWQTKTTASQRRWPAIPLCRPKPRKMLLSQTHYGKGYLRKHGSIVGTVFPCFPLFSSQMHFLTNHLDSFTGPILSEKLFESTSSVHRLHMILTNEASTADLAFDPTLACWSFSYPALASHNSLSRFSRQDLLLNRTMLSSPFDCVTWIVLAATAIDFQPQTCDAY